MKNKALAFGILQIIVLAIISVFIYKTDKENYKISSLFIFGVIGGIVAVLYSGYITPTKLIFKYRFWIEGFLFGIGSFLFSTLTDLTENGSFDTSNIIRKVLVGAGVGVLVFGSMRYWIYTSIKKNTPFKSIDCEKEILADAARIETDDINENGRLILTTNRLYFISSAKNSKIIFDISNKDTTEIQIVYKFGIPNGIFIVENATKIHVRFPGTWMREIEKV